MCEARLACAVALTRLPPADVVGNRGGSRPASRTAPPPAPRAGAFPVALFMAHTLLVPCSRSGLAALRPARRFPCADSGTVAPLSHSRAAAQHAPHAAAGRPHVRPGGHGDAGCVPWASQLLWRLCPSTAQVPATPRCISPRVASLPSRLSCPQAPPWAPAAPWPTGRWTPSWAPAPSCTRAPPPRRRLRPPRWVRAVRR